MDKRQLKKDFSFLKGKVMAVLLFGSRIKRSTPRSDFDICIVAPKEKDSKIIREVYRHVDVNKNKYDVHTFNELPLNMKIDIINKHEEIYVKDRPELHEYFYFYRKLWNDQKHRNEMTKEEVLRIVS